MRSDGTVSLRSNQRDFVGQSVLAHLACFQPHCDAHWTLPAEIFIPGTHYRTNKRALTTHLLNAVYVLYRYEGTGEEYF